ncbi:hypothetical protein [Paraflavitalea pollutisoli]|uniref:hypothetical protein n=1 Tax=Paraflavitalea pollutisoli TaxID=3034143 RepID=UPI0023ECAC01|nr:hypothetical protein [Paraflavitalea sp. H1-2-19X]
MQKRKLTADDLERNPDLKDWGLKEGHEIGIPEGDELNLTDEEDPGGIEVPKKPPPPLPGDGQ